MKWQPICLLWLLLTGCSTNSASLATPSVTENLADLAGPEQSDLFSKRWYAGAEDCKLNSAPPIEVYQHDVDTYVLRQNKCMHFEAPFIYLLFGEKTALLLDTGAIADADQFPLKATVDAIFAKRRSEGLKGDQDLLILHSHGHSDHTQADEQFAGQAGVTLVPPSLSEIKTHFDLKNWPEDSTEIDLGGRNLIIMPIPGHHEQSIAIYDPATQWLLTGDTFYPGKIYVQDWQQFRTSIKAMVKFSQHTKVKALMGAHIEMSRTPGVFYPIGSQYHPDEAPLALSTDVLLELHLALQSQTEINEIVLDRLIVAPKNRLQKALSNLVNWFTD